MFNLPKNDPKDEDFIKRAHNDPNWPKGLDTPCDWNKVSLWGKIWFKIGNTVKMLTTLIIIFLIVGACSKLFFKENNSILPDCEPSPQGCYER